MAEPKRRTPIYKTVNGFTIAGCMSEDVYLSGLDYKPSPNDLFIASYPKCGTTWTQMIVFLIRNKGKPAQGNVEFYKKMPFLEMIGLEFQPSDIYSVKIHLPFSMAPYSPEAKYIYVTRNPRDAVVSFYHHTRSPAYAFDDGEFDVYFDLFMEGKVDFGDYFDHVLSWYEHRHDKNVLFITYEDLKADTRGMVLKIARFMGEEYEKMLRDHPEVLENVLKYSSMEEMKKILNEGMDATTGDPSVTEADIDAMPVPFGIKYMRKFMLKHRSPDSKPFHLIRKGQVGGWRSALTVEQINRINKKVEEKLRGTDLYELYKDK